MATGEHTHERMVQVEPEQRSSDRAFGIVFAVVFGIIALRPLLGGEPVRMWAVAISGVFLALSLTIPRALAPLNRVWLAIGFILHKITSPVVLGLMFYGAVTPMAFMFRLRGKDPLRLKLDKAAASYWIDRRPPGPLPATMTNQF